MNQLLMIEDDVRLAGMVQFVKQVQENLAKAVTG